MSYCFCEFYRCVNSGKYLTQSPWALFSLGVTRRSFHINKNNSYIAYFSATETKIEIRLIGGNDTAGTVEVNYLGQWGVVCDDNWDDSDATVVCSMLGYDTG